MAGTVATLHIVGEDDTILLCPYGMTNLYRRLVLSLYLFYGTSGADLAASVAFRTAIASLV